MLKKLLMLWPPYLRRVVELQELIINELCREFKEYDDYIEDKLKEVGFADWEIYGKDGPMGYKPTENEKIDLFVDKIKEQISSQ